MPPLEQMDLNQRAVRWTRNPNPDAYGKPTISLPGVELAVRWNDKKGVLRTKDDQTVAYDAMVISDRAYQVGDVLWLGTAASLPGSGLPPSNVLEVLRAEQYKSLDGRYTRHENYLARLTDVLPVGA